MKSEMSFPPQAAGIWVWSKWMGMAADILVFLNQIIVYSFFFEILCVRVFACTNVCALCVCTYAYSESEEGLGSLGTGVTDTVSCGC